MKMLARYGLAAAAVVLLLLCLRVLLQLPPPDDGDHGTSARRAPPAWGQEGQGVKRDTDRRHDGLVRNNPLLTGEMGRGVVLAPEEKARGDAALRKYNVNVLASDLISLNRQVPDSRPTGCESQHYPSELPSTAVVIPFHNEWPSVLLRTVHSIVSRTPPSLLKQIILVDDASDLATLKEELDLYLQEHFPENLVQVVRLPQRAGLIRARLEGFRHVTTEVVSFFDSHMEVNVDWLQPLLVEIKRDRRTVAMGHLDYIQPDTFQYSYVPEYHTRYGFDWRLVFFETYFLKSQERGKTVSDPLPGVVMVGPAFAINSDYFREIGTYDSGMKIWGGENLELAWRVWLCGGRLVHLPCSKIGHIARPQPYSFPEGRYETEIHNYKRAVEVWMGPYKRFVYEHHPRMKELDVGDLTERLLLKKHLGCRNFSWFLKNVWPELYPYNDNATHWGGVTHLSETLCLDNGEFLFVGPEPLRTKRCNFNSFSQGFSLTTDRRLRTTLQCVGVQEEGEDMVPVLITCNDDVVHTWTYTPDKQLKHDQTGLCLQLMQGPKLVMQVCRKGEEAQVWEFREQGDPTSIADLEVDQAQRQRERSATMETKSPVQMLYELEQQMRNMSLNLHQPILKDFTALGAGHVRRDFDTPEGEGQKISAAPGKRLKRPEIPAVRGAVGDDVPRTRDLIFTPKGHGREIGVPLQHLRPGELLRAKEDDIMRWTGSEWTRSGGSRSKKEGVGNMAAVNRPRQRTAQRVHQVHVKRQPDHRVWKPRSARFGDDVVEQDMFDNSL